MGANLQAPSRLGKPTIGGCRAVARTANISRVIASIPSPPSGAFHVGPLLVHLYGLIASWRARGRCDHPAPVGLRGGSRDLVADVALWAFPAGLVGGRLYHL